MEVTRIVRVRSVPAAPERTVVEGTRKSGAAASPVQPRRPDPEVAGTRESGAAASPAQPRRPDPEVAETRESGAAASPTAPRRLDPERDAGRWLDLERLALVALVFGRERAPALLEGLLAPEAKRARGLLAGFAALSSARRQARVAVEFGTRPEATARLRALMEEAPEVLREELFRGMPPYHRSLFPGRQVAPPRASVTEAVAAWAERLLREATR